MQNNFQSHDTLQGWLKTEVNGGKAAGETYKGSRHRTQYNLLHAISHPPGKPSYSRHGPQPRSRRRHPQRLSQLSLGRKVPTDYKQKSGMYVGIPILHNILQLILVIRLGQSSSTYINFWYSIQMYSFCLNIFRCQPRWLIFVKNVGCRCTLYLLALLARRVLGQLDTIKSEIRHENFI